MMHVRSLIAAAAFLFSALQVHANIRITEWMYGGDDGEFVEFTNVGSAGIDMAGWSFDDDSRTPGSFSLSGFGMVLPGQSVILTEAAAAGFRQAWGLTASVIIIGASTNNLGRADELNIFDAAGQSVDRLTFNDQGALGPRTNNVSGNIPFAVLGTNNPNAAVLSVAEDVYGSWTSTGGDIGNPGVYSLPEPTSLITLIGGAMILFGRRHRFVQ